MSSPSDNSGKVPVQHWEVSPAEDGMKLASFLLRRLDGAVPKSAVMRWIRTGQVRVDGSRSGPFTRLDAGTTVRVPPHRVEGSDADIPEARSSGALTIVHEDENLLVLAKPSGLPVQPGSRHADSLQTRIAARHAGAGFRPACVHRLDRDTTGLVLAGKTHAALRGMSDLFRQGRVEKIYLAWVAGSWPGEGESVLEDRLAKKRRGTREVVETGAGRQALAQVRPLCRRENATLLAVRLVTGRTHQIRVQLASRGHPVLGDRKYGRKPHRTSLLLHAAVLGLPERSFILPPDWSAPWNAEPALLEGIARGWSEQIPRGSASP